MTKSFFDKIAETAFALLIIVFAVCVVVHVGQAVGKPVTKHSAYVPHTPGGP